MSDAPPIEVRGLVKRYGELTAVAGVDLTVEAGDVYGYLGPNGAGKTTSLRMMLGLIRPTAGSVRLFGVDPQQTIAALRGVAGLADRAKDRVGGYSHGMRQRLGIAAALLRDPKLLLLDEPATGLDPAGMRDMRLLIVRLAAQGMTVMLSSHLMNEVEEVCNRVAIVRTGKVVYEGEIAALKRGAGVSYRLTTTNDERALAVCQAQRGIGDVKLEHGAISFTAEPGAAAELSRALVEAGALITAMGPETLTLEDLFFSLTEGAEPVAVGSNGAAPVEVTS
jgi:ABC-2 type transport system ATP-binding protein